LDTLEIVSGEVDPGEYPEPSVFRVKRRQVTLDLELGHSAIPAAFPIGTKARGITDGLQFGQSVV
jgi:hypothetical protein